MEAKEIRRELVELESEYFNIAGSVTRKVEKYSRLCNRIQAVKEETKNKRNSLANEQRHGKQEFENKIGCSEQLVASALDQIILSMVNRASEKRSVTVQAKHEETSSLAESAVTLPNIVTKAEDEQVLDATLDVFFDSLDKIYSQDQPQSKDIVVSNSLLEPKVLSKIRVRLHKNLTVADLINLCQRQWGLQVKNKESGDADFIIVDQGGVIWPDQAFVNSISNHLRQSNASETLYIQAKEIIDFGKVLDILQNADEGVERDPAPFVSHAQELTIDDETKQQLEARNTRDSTNFQRVRMSRVKKMAQSWWNYDPVLNTNTRLRKDILATIVLLAVLAIVQFSFLGQESLVRASLHQLVDRFLVSPNLPPSLSPLGPQTQAESFPFPFSNTSLPREEYGFRDIRTWSDTILWIAGSLEPFLVVSNFGSLHEAAGSIFGETPLPKENAWQVLEPVRMRKSSVLQNQCSSPKYSKTIPCYPGYSSASSAEALPCPNQLCATFRTWQNCSECQGGAGTFNSFNGEFSRYDSFGFGFDVGAKDLRVLANSTSSSYIDSLLPSWLDNPSTRLFTVEFYVITYNIQVISLVTLWVEMDATGLYSSGFSVDSLSLTSTSLVAVRTFALAVALLAILYFIYIKRRYLLFARAQYVKRDMLMTQGAHGAPKGSSPFYQPNTSMLKTLMEFYSSWWQLFDSVMIISCVAAVTMQLLVLLDSSPDIVLHSSLDGGQPGPPLGHLIALTRWVRDLQGILLLLLTIRLAKFIRFSKLQDGHNVFSAVVQARYPLVLLTFMYLHVQIALSILATFTLGDLATQFKSTVDAFQTFESLSMRWQGSLDHVSIAQTFPVGFPLLYFTKSWIIDSIYCGMVVAILFESYWGTLGTPSAIKRASGQQAQELETVP